MSGGGTVRGSPFFPRIAIWVGLVTLPLLILPVLGTGAAQAQGVGQAPAAAAGGIQAAGAKYRIVRAISGSKGSEQAGQFVFDDPRTVFYLPEDKQAIVYFEWEGPAGLHVFEGLWRNPEGKVVVISDFKYEAKEGRFGAYWTLKLDESMATGVWALEVRIDGEMAGVHSFQIVTAPRPALETPVRRPLGPSEIYQLGLERTVFVDALDSSGARLRTGSGFFISEGQAVTAFEVIDGAAAVRLRRHDGKVIPVEGVVSWNRLEDWTVLWVLASAVSPMKPAENGSWAVGDRCYAFDVPQEANRTLVAGNITGEQKFQELGERINLSFSLQPEACGSPVLNEYGEVIGLSVRRSLLPGSVSIGDSTQGYPVNLLIAGAYYAAQAALAVPINRVSFTAGPTSPVHLAKLADSGQFTPHLSIHRDIIHGTLARDVDAKGPVPSPVDERFEFSRRDPRLVIFLRWNPTEKVRTTAYCQFYDLHNRAILRTNPVKIKLDRGRIAVTAWNVEIGSLPPGLYRVDVIVDPNPVWRSFFRLAE